MLLNVFSSNWCIGLLSANISAVRHPGIKKVSRMRLDIIDENIGQVLRFATACAYEYLIAPADVFEVFYSDANLSGISKLLFILLKPTLFCMCPALSVKQKLSRCIGQSESL